MEKSNFFKIQLFLVLSLFGLIKVNAAFIDNPDKVDIVQLPGFDGDGSLLQYYVADLGDTEDLIVWSAETDNNSRWYRIPAGSVNDGVADVQAYYYKNVATGRYLYISEAIQTELVGKRDGDWPTARAHAVSTNEKTDNFKWFIRSAPWDWGVYITNAARIDLTQPEGNRYNSLTSIILMKVNETPGKMLDPNVDFFGVHVPNVSVGSFKGGLGNAWTAMKKAVVVEANVLNPDKPHFLSNTKTVNVVQFSTWMVPNNSKLTKDKPYASDVDGLVEFSTDGFADNTKWYEIPAGGNEYGFQLYYYKNVATGAYLQGSTVDFGGGDWTVSTAVTSPTNDKSDLYKWSKMSSAWGEGIWLVSEKGNTGMHPSDEHKNAFFALTMLTANSEFFGVDAPNLAVSNPHSGGNAWTAVELKVAASGVDNPDYKIINPSQVSVIQISTWMNPNNSKLAGKKPYVADVDGFVVYETVEIGADHTKWYEIPAGEGTFGQQVYYYKNVGTGSYLSGSDTDFGNGDWTVTAAKTSKINDGSDLYKWSKAASNWGNGPWLVNEKWNTGKKPSGDTKNAFFALTMLTANSEFFGVDVPNVAISNPHDGGNAWTAVEIIEFAKNVANPDYESEGAYPYSIAGLNFFATDGGEDPNAASYDVGAHTITYKNGGWHRAGWNWEAEGGLDVPNFNQVWIKFDGSQLPKTGDGEGGATKIQYDVVYMDDTNAADENSKSNEIRSSDTEYYYNLTPGKKIKRITLKSEVEGNLVLTDAYFFKKNADPVDLIVTDITWDPINPMLADSITFSAKIKNNSEFASQNVKHAVNFLLKAPPSTTTTLVTWSDTHDTALAPGEEIVLTANMGIKDSAKWKFGLARSYMIIAQVNSMRDVIETDYTNNTFEKEIVILPTGLDNVKIAGNINVADGKLYLNNFPEGSIATIYNLQAVELGRYDANKVTGLSLQKSLYILKIQDGERLYSTKVLIH